MATPSSDQAGGRADDRTRGRPGVDPDLFRDAMARWAATVTVVAARGADDGRVRATTATSFAPVSAEPPEVVVSLSPGAQVLPFLDVGGPVGISLLAADQRQWARLFADSYPVGPSPWPEEGVPLISGAVAGLACTVRAIHPTEGRSRLVVARIEGVALGGDLGPLLYANRTYRRLAPLDDEGA
jgi:flavin reductase (DIM6/NTAB) family NADH-FMN oxidoreductase RutF